MISEIQISENKKEFISLLKEIKRDGADINGLIAKLENSDFFEAPASAKYHASYKGGLCEHCLNVYYNLMHLAKYKGFINPEDYNEQMKESITIVALLHDISKMNLYKKSSRNVKKYSPNGSKYDELGNFDWVAELTYETKSVEERFIYGNHEITSEYMIRYYIPLTVEESSAIIHHMGGKSWDSAQDNIAEVYNKYPLSVLLHMADMLSTYIDERI